MGHQLISIGEAAEELGAHPAAVFAATQRLGIRVAHIGRLRVIERAQLEAVEAEITRRLLATRREVR